MMMLRVSKKRVYQIRIQEYIAVIYTLVLSGSVFHYAYMSSLGVINKYLTLILGTYHIFKHRSSFFKIKKNIGDVFVVLAATGLGFNMVLWNEISYASAYLGKLCLILMPWLIVKMVPLERFVEAFIRVIFLIVVFSLIFYNFSNLLMFWPIDIPIDTARWNYNFYGVYARFQETTIEILQRNIGVFWEAGMYQGFVVFAMALVILLKPLNWKTIVYLAIMIWCIFTIQSTTGYLLLLPMFVLVFLKVVSVNRLATKIGIVILVCGSGFFALFGSEFLTSIINGISPDILVKLNPENSSSTATRLYGTIIDIKLALTNPLGVGVFSADSMRKQVGLALQLLGVSANINTTFNMMLDYGIIPGSCFFLMMIKACVNMSENKMIAVCMVVICLVIINTEPHYLTIFFTTIFMYYSQKRCVNTEVAKK